MIRKAFKSNKKNSKLDALIKKYKIPREYLAINRKSVTRGLFWGLFWGFIPMPMQMLAVLGVTPFMKFNVPVAFTMVWLSNPLTMPFMYYMEYKTGNFLLAREGIKNVELTLDWFQKHWDDIVVPLYVGTVPYSIGVSLFTAVVVNYLWIASVRKHQLKRCKRDSKFSKEPKDLQGCSANKDS